LQQVDTLVRPEDPAGGGGGARSVVGGARLLALIALAAVAMPAAPRAQDARDLPYVSALLSQALETERTNVEIPWSNPETGNGGTIEITRTYYRDSDNTPCRDYTRTVGRPGAPPVIARGTGCRVGPARWELDEETVIEAAAAPSTSATPRSAAPSPLTPTPPPAATPRETPATRDTAAVCPEPPDATTAAADPPKTVVVPLGKPPAFTAYTLPSRARL
jgi:surface antigen